MASRGISDQDTRQLELLSQLALCNPLLPGRIQIEQQLLGTDFVPESRQAWSRRLGQAANDRPNIDQITILAGDLVDRIGSAATPRNPLRGSTLEHYWNVASYVLLYRHIVPRMPEELFTRKTAGVWKAFAEDYARFAAVPGVSTLRVSAAGHLFACLCQVHRAFVNTFDCILGDSAPSVRLRGAIWQSIFTTDLRRYRQQLFDRMKNLPVLITGPTGTGKELVARAIGLSQYIPFDEQRGRFATDNPVSFFPLNISALSESLVESELFGHCRGAFTGAVAQRAGWLEQCEAHSAVFLDEIGELAASLQVKLLRVVQQRTYTRIGETEERHFCGKIIGATNRDMKEEIQSGRFREDLFFRLCADRIQTPSLREQLDDRPEDLHALCLYIAQKVAGDDSSSLAEQSVEWIDRHLGPDYAWRGNIRELEQCICSIMIRGEYTPVFAAEAEAGTTGPEWLRHARRGTLTAEQLLQHYCLALWKELGSYEATARTLKLDRRTVRQKVQRCLQAQADSTAT